MSDDKLPLPVLSADEYATFDAMPLLSAAQFHLYTGIGINEVRAAMRDGRYPVDPDNPRLIVRALALDYINTQALRAAERKRAESRRGAV